MPLSALKRNRDMSDENSDTLWYSGKLDVFLNRWFAVYEEARQSLEDEGGFLLPYRHQFFVCDPGAIRYLGLDPDDPDWEQIGRDAAQPVDREAYQRLQQKREQAVQDGLG